MSRFSRALAAMARLAAAAGGGLLIAAAGAAPAPAAAPATAAAGPAPAGGHTFTFAVQAAAGSALDAGPRDVLPCVVRPGAKPAAGCGAETVRCTLTAAKPFVSSVSHKVFADANVQCDEEVATLVLHETLSRDGAQVAGASDTQISKPAAATVTDTACSPGTYTNTADVSITVRDGYVLVGGAAHRSVTSAPLRVGTFDCDLVMGGSVP